MKLPTEDQWDEMAEAFDTPLCKRNGRQRMLTYRSFALKSMRRRGICRALTMIGCFYIDGFETEVEAYEWMKKYFGDNRINAFGFWASTTNAGDRKRTFFCCMMAAITEAGDMESMIEGV